MTQKIVVSKAGYNVLTETDIDNLVFSSDYNTLKYSLANGTKSVVVSNNTLGEFSFQEEITHGLGYKPFFKAYAYYVGYSPVGIFYIEDYHNVHLMVTVDNNKMYFIASGNNVGETVITGGDLGIKYSEFENTWKNQYLTVLSPGQQCFDVVVGWTNLLGIPHYPGHPSPFPYANAYQIYTDFGSFQNEYFERIINTVSNAPPQVGDIVVWEDAYNGAGGHTGVASGNSTYNTFQAFVQNDPTGSYCYEKDYSYDHVLGWLRPRDQGTTVTVVPDDINFTAVFQYKIFKNNLNL